RQFAPDGDPKGLPVSWGFRPDPVIPIPSGAPVVPRLGGQHRLEDARVIATLPHLLPEDANVLIRAARSYQEAMWIADVTPELTWLMLVSAVETAAHAWRAKKDPPLDRLRFGMPKLAKLLDSRDDPAFTAEVSRLIADYVGATENFCDFVLEFLPDAPESRPPPFAQHVWKPDAFRKSLKIVYDYRSRALHGGRPFPAPMCYPPMRVGDPEEHVEVPFAMGVGASFWQAEDAPIHLNTFEYLARRALLGWWHWMAEAHVNDEH
ncbi:MAG: hypothetical protein M3442_19950, partial [Chloroflexota bacterium]|nr:hypothetical protein [Chloroflexota bacterium]